MKVKVYLAHGGVTDAGEAWAMASIVASSEGSSATRAADFEYERVARFVAHAACKRLALQFPDALLSLSPAVAMELEAFLPDPKPEVYVLGDPAPGGAVDCVAAAHVDAASQRPAAAAAAHAPPPLAAAATRAVARARIHSAERTVAPATRASSLSFGRVV